MIFSTRFAPSPTGPLHLGHAYSALLAQDIAKQNDGAFLLRIEDIDQSRARSKWETQIYDDLTWLGLEWPDPVMRQSDRLSEYRSALDDLWKRGFIYPCHCTRRDIADAISAPQEGVPLRHGPDGLIYPGTCRSVAADRQTRCPDMETLRLNMHHAVQACGNTDMATPFHFQETGLGPNGETGDITFSAEEVLNDIGDIVLARKGMGTSYHLSVVLDDAAQGITHVVRGQDLFEATKIHVVLQNLLGLPTPIYHHHRLIRDTDGKRLAKRDDARAIAKYRDEGVTPGGIRKMVGLN